VAIGFGLNSATSRSTTEIPVSTPTTTPTISVWEKHNQAHLEPELRKFGFDPQLVASTMDADPDAISELVRWREPGFLKQSSPHCPPKLNEAIKANRSRRPTLAGVPGPAGGKPFGQVARLGDRIIARGVAEATSVAVRQ
jgi:hypothetical protein